MILSGIDIVLVARVERLLKEGPFCQKVYTEGELQEAARIGRRGKYLAGRFAAKEACMKALGTGWSKGVEWKDIEVSTSADGTPSLILHRRAKELSRGGAPHLSIACTGGVAVATVMIETSQDRGTSPDGYSL